MVRINYNFIVLFLLLKDISPKTFEESPIIFGDFIKIGATGSDRIYEELTDMKKLFAVLSEV